MTDELETEIRKALDARAHEVDVPVDLMTRTLEAARAGTKRSLRDRFRARLDTWRMRLPVTGYPRWLYAGAAAATVIALFGVGTLVTRPLGSDKHASVEMAGGSAVPGQVTGVNTSGGNQKVLSHANADTATKGAGGTSSNALTAPTVPQKFAPKIVRKASIEVEVKSFDGPWERANDVATTYGGFVTNSSTSSADDKLARGTVTMRIPADRLDDALDALRALGKVARTSTSAVDISGQLIDIDARLKTLQTEEAELLDLLRGAHALPDILSVRSRLDSVRTQIEELNGQKAYQTDQVAYATVKATIFERGAQEFEPTAAEPGILADGWDTALRVGLKILAGLLVVLGGLVPLAVIGVLVWLLVGALRRRRNAA